MKTFGFVVAWLCFPWLMAILTICGVFDEDGGSS
jgi:hypothetical protein